jgi:hypothetical protein
VTTLSILSSLAFILATPNFGTMVEDGCAQDFTRGKISALLFQGCRISVHIWI